MMSIKDKYKDYFKIGAAVNTRTVETSADLIKTHFNSLTCENETKFSSLVHEEDNYNFRRADQIVQFARENQLAMRGHTFTWHNQTPKWVFQNVDREGLLSRLRKHMEIAGKRYEEDFHCWDVVNEAIEDKTDLFLRKSPWTEIIGDDFIDEAFKMAKEILPNTELFYNDYNATVPEKRDKIYQLIKGMKERGVPIDGVGLQGHFNIYSPSKDQIREAIEKYASLGLRLHFTEMDISVYGDRDEKIVAKPTEEMLELQAKAYGDAFALFREYKDVIDSVTLWGVGDDYSWLDHFPVRNRKSWPLLFDEQHQPKEAFYRIMDF